jgi:hypothetical protein
MSIRRARTSRGPLVIACLAALWFAVPSAAQTVGGTLVGRVRDQSAGTLPHASVAITNVATGVVTSVVTNAEGFYSVPNLLPGPDEVMVAFDGFSSQTTKGLTLANPALDDLSLGFIPGFPIGSISVPGLTGTGDGPGAADYKGESTCRFDQ